MERTNGMWLVRDDKNPSLVNVVEVMNSRESRHMMTFESNDNTKSLLARLCDKHNADIERLTGTIGTYENTLNTLRSILGLHDQALHAHKKHPFADGVY